MIRYSLRCAEDHAFESWFQSAAAYDGLAAALRLSCPVCGSSRIEKALMAPAVRPARSAVQTADLATAPASAGPVANQSDRPSLRDAGSDSEHAFAALRRKVEENSEYVGLNFVAEARAIHDGDAPERSIYGEARFEDAKKLIEDGVPVAPLPFMPGRKMN